MASRDIWRHGSGRQLQDLLASALITLLLPASDAQPAYFVSPWVSDFALLGNRCREVAALVPELAEQDEIRFIDYLLQLARVRPVRIVTTANPTSNAFLTQLRARQADGAPTPDVRIADATSHEKGILAPSFYIEGSMNITYSGVFIRGEKITYHVPSPDDNGDGAQRIARAYLELGRQWESLRRGGPRVPRSA